MTQDNITSIGWLYGTDKTINLTPCFDNQSHPVFVNVSQESFDATNGDKVLMKKLALDTLQATTITLTNKQKFMNRLNAAIDNDAIEVIEQARTNNAFHIKLTCGDFENDELTPSEDLRELMSNEALDCFGVELCFNNDNTAFWVNV